jgi:hypothetical protein
MPNADTFMPSAGTLSEECEVLVLQVNSVKCQDEQWFLVLDLRSFDGTNS